MIERLFLDQIGSLRNGSAIVEREQFTVNVPPHPAKSAAAGPDAAVVTAEIALEYAVRCYMIKVRFTHTASFAGLRMECRFAGAVAIMAAKE
jgi:hypothetical protein